MTGFKVRQFEMSAAHCGLPSPQRLGRYQAFQGVEPQIRPGFVGGPREEVGRCLGIDPGEVPATGQTAGPAVVRGQIQTGNSGLSQFRFAEVCEIFRSEVTAAHVGAVEISGNRRLAIPAANFHPVDVFRTLDVWELGTPHGFVCEFRGLFPQLLFFATLNLARFLLPQQGPI